MLEHKINICQDKVKEFQSLSLKAARNQVIKHNEMNQNQNSAIESTESNNDSKTS